jgi:DNA-directed RNA polymerase specialized sigma24 family protein
MARLFVVDRNAAEDLVQEAFIRLSRSLGRVSDETKHVALSALDRAEPRP